MCTKVPGWSLQSTRALVTAELDQGTRLGRGQPVASCGGHTMTLKKP